MSRRWAWLAAAVFGLAGFSWAGLDSLDPKTATLDELIFHAQRYGNTSGKIERKTAAWEELKARGPAALDALMLDIHLENVGIHVMAMQLVERLDKRQAVPVLLPFLDDTHDRTRKTAIFFLGLYDAPVRAARIVPFLADEEAAGAAMRTLGKWRVKAAVTDIVPFLRHPREVRRVAAANALRDIGGASAAASLVEALDDPVFTVRETASRALVKLGKPVEKELIRALATAQGHRQRCLIRILGERRSRQALSLLRSFARDKNEAVRRDAVAAIAAIRRQPL